VAQIAPLGTLRVHQIHIVQPPLALLVTLNALAGILGMGQPVSACRKMEGHERAR